MYIGIPTIVHTHTCVSTLCVPVPVLEPVPVRIGEFRAGVRYVSILLSDTRDREVLYTVQMYHGTYW